MHYIIQILTAILVGVAIGALLGSRNKLLSIGSIACIVLGAVAFFTVSWLTLAAATVIFLAVQAMQRETYPVRV